MKKIRFPWGDKSLPKPVEMRTPVVYYGGKSRDADWVISQFPPHTTFVDVFGGGGAITFAKRPSTLDVYNDIGNVSRFMRVCQIYGEELYLYLYHLPFSREVFDWAHDNWAKFKEDCKELKTKESALLWAATWYVQISQSYTHSEFDSSWRIAKDINFAQGIRNHVDSLPYISERLRSITIEHLSFERVIQLYDKRGTLFYCDPPYVSETRESPDVYGHEMPIGKHRELLEMLNRIEGQCIVSGYDHPLYEELTKGWRIVRKTAKSSIQNSKQMDNRGDRTEVLWIREHQHGLWAAAPEESPTDVPGVSLQLADSAWP